MNHHQVVHYAPSKEVVVSYDAISHGVGGVLAHGVEHPILFVSATSSKSKSNYSQLESNFQSSQKSVMSASRILRRSYSLIAS